MYRFFLNSFIKCRLDKIVHLAICLHPNLPQMLCSMLVVSGSIELGSHVSKFVIWDQVNQ